MSETLPQDTQPREGVQDGGENKSNSIELAKLNEMLGKDFKDVDTALKSIKDTQSFVGKKMEAVKDPTIEEKLDNLEKQLNESNFYRENPQYDNEDARNLIKELGGNPTEVIEKDIFKNTFEKISAYNKSQESKSILHNSSRLGQVSTKMDEASSSMAKADEAASRGNLTEAIKMKDLADDNAVASVIDSFSK